MHVSDRNGRAADLGGSPPKEDVATAQWERPKCIWPGKRKSFSVAVQGAQAAEPSEEPAFPPGRFVIMPRTNQAPVTIDHERASPEPVEYLYQSVIGGCFERMTMLARHREERSLESRPRTEMRLLAQVDAIAAAGA